MPKLLPPEKYIKTELIRKREPGHEYRSPDGSRSPHFHPGWYFFAYRPIKYGPFPNQEAALNAGIEHTIQKRAKCDVDT